MQLTEAQSIFLAYEPFLASEEDIRQLRSDFQTSGVAVLGPPAMAEPLFRELAEEAEVQRRIAAWPLKHTGGATALSEDNMRAHLGPRSRELMAAGATRALLQAIAGRPVTPGWSASCLTYYDEPGRYMGFHCDKPDACAVALLLTLAASWPEERELGPGLQLLVYGDDTPTDLRVRVTSRANRVVILNGSKLAHERPPMAEGERVVLLAGCYAFAS